MRLERGQRVDAELFLVSGAGGSTDFPPLECLTIAKSNSLYGLGSLIIPACIQTLLTLLGFLCFRMVFLLNQGLCRFNILNFLVNATENICARVDLEPSLLVGAGPWRIAPLTENVAVVRV